jgi:AraC-like DNA-binding protein
MRALFAFLDFSLVRGIVDMDVRVEIVIGKVEASSGDPRLTLRLFASRLGLSERRLAGLFKQFTGRTFRVYLLQIRLKRVMDLLYSPSTLSIKEIAHRFGYGSTSSLDRDFQKIYGVRPSEIRKQTSPSVPLSNSDVSGPNL